MSWRRLAAMKTRLLLVLASIPLLAQVPVTSPYSAVQVSETTQTLGDGTHISHVGMKVLIYRDSSGRTRREMFPSPPPGASPTVQIPRLVTIMDPVAGYIYSLDVANKIARRTQMPKAGQPVASAALNAPTGALSLGLGTVNSGSAVAITPNSGSAPSAPPPVASRPRPQTKNDPIGTQVIEGLLCDGTRNTITYPVGMFGNDRDIVATGETWISQELHIPVLIKRSDPRSGENVTKLTDINRSEPDPAFFAPPPDYTIQDQPTLAPPKQ